MHQACRILHKMSEGENNIAAINKRVAKLLRSNPSKIGGQHMLLKAMISAAKGRKDYVLKAGFCFKLRSFV